MSDPRTAPRLKTWSRALRLCLDQVAGPDHRYYEHIPEQHRWPIDGKATWLQVLVDLNLVQALSGSDKATDRILNYLEPKAATEVGGADGGPLTVVLKQYTDLQKAEGTKH